mmetsp:Transcript_46005/g.127759  ORF Transcript_46005/g.127759 Transcript_46005/m.127759 type:complete len:255 (+) Transcript_46005:117-881(+)
MSKETPEENRILKALEQYNTPQITNVVGSYPGRNEHCLGIYNPWTVNWYTDNTVRGVCGLPHGVRRCGFAVTMCVEVKDPNYPCPPQWPDVLDAIEASPKPCILIIQQKFPPELLKRFGLVGGNMATHMTQLGCVGVVSNGPQRDVDEIESMGLACISGGLSPGHGNWSISGINIPVTVASMDVVPGEVVHMDEHGAAKFPRALLPDVERECKLMQDKEDVRLAKVREVKTAAEIRQILGAGDYGGDGKKRKFS